MRSSISRRLAVMFAAAGIIVYVTGGFFLHRSLVSALEHQIAGELGMRFQVLEELLGKSQPALWYKVSDKLDALTPGDGSTRYWIYSADPRLHYGTLLPGQAELFAGPDGFGELSMGEELCPMKTLLGTIPANGQRSEIRVMVGLDSTPFSSTLNTFTITLVGLSVVGILLVSALGYWIPRIGLHPLRRLSVEANLLSPTNLSQRLRTDALPRELSTVVTAFNGALARLETAYKQLETFNADVAHEIRTPLTNLIGQTQVALTRDRTKAELQEVLHSNLEELDRLRGIVNDMLFLARADQGVMARDRRPTQIAAEVVKTVEFLEPIIEESGAHVRIVGDACAAIETALFRRAMSNLLQNAIQHSPRRSEILVTITQDTLGTTVSVTNSGSSIPEEHLGRLFDRFYRVNAARSNSDDNHGLGLSIVKAIATMHLGTVFARSKDGWTTIGFTIA